MDLPSLRKKGRDGFKNASGYITTLVADGHAIRNVVARVDIADLLSFENIVSGAIRPRRTPEIWALTSVPSMVRIVSPLRT